MSFIECTCIRLILQILIATWILFPSMAQWKLHNIITTNFVQNYSLQFLKKALLDHHIKVNYILRSVSNLLLASPSQKSSQIPVSNYRLCGWGASLWGRWHIGWMNAFLLRKGFLILWSSSSTNIILQNSRTGSFCHCIGMKWLSKKARAWPSRLDV